MVVIMFSTDTSTSSSFLQLYPLKLQVSGGSDRQRGLRDCRGEPTIGMVVERQGSLTNGECHSPDIPFKVSAMIASFPDPSDCK